MHNNLFKSGHSPADVKMSLARDQKRDSGTIRLLDAVVLVCVLYLVRDLPRLDAVAIIVAVVAGISGMRYFVDQSVRNFYLHRLDWDDANADERRGLYDDK
jgi:hypothetical protein